MCVGQLLFCGGEMFKGKILPVLDASDRNWDALVDRLQAFADDARSAAASVNDELDRTFKTSRALVRAKTGSRLAEAPSEDLRPPHLGDDRLQNRLRSLAAPLQAHIGAQAASLQPVLDEVRSLGAPCVS